MNLPPYKLITSQQEWETCLAALNQHQQVAIDLEANSMYAYREQVCLIQISIPTQDYIVDPLYVPDLGGLGLLLQNPEIEKIFHAAEYDLTLLKNQFDWELTNLFDTMWAARILGYPRYGLASLLEELYNIEMDKRYQRSNWCKRPLSPEQLIYAQLDTHHLIQLREHLWRELQEAGRTVEALEIFAEQTHIKGNHREFNPEGFWHLSGAYDLNRTQQAVLKELYNFREEEAERRDQPLFKVFSDRTLLECAQYLPNDHFSLRKIHGMSSGQVRRYGTQILRLVAQAKENPPPPFPTRTKRPPDAVSFRYDMLHTWRKELAKERGVESDVIMSRDALWAIAWQNPQSLEELAQIEEIGVWRCGTYGADLIRLLTKRAQKSPS